MAGKGSKPGEYRGGRRKGTPNKKTVLFQLATERMIAEGVDPIEILCKAAKGIIKSPIRVRAAIELAKYGWAQRKAIEVSGIGGGPIEVEHVGSASTRIASLMDRLATRTESGDVGGSGAGSEEQTALP